MTHSSDDTRLSRSAVGAWVLAVRGGWWGVGAADVDMLTSQRATDVALKAFQAGSASQVCVCVVVGGYVLVVRVP